jgi:hypothetical protein
MKLTDNEIRDINRYLEEGKPLPEKYRFLLFEDKREVELVWNGKTSEVCNVVLPFQVIEQVDEPREEKAVKLQMDLFDMQTGRQIKGWNNKLIWGDNKLILSSLKNGPLREEIEAQGGIKLIYIDPPFDVGADFSMDIEIGGETLTKKPGILEEIACIGMGQDIVIKQYELAETILEQGIEIAHLMCLSFFDGNNAERTIKGTPAGYETDSSVLQFGIKGVIGRKFLNLAGKTLPDIDSGTAKDKGFAIIVSQFTYASLRCWRVENTTSIDRFSSLDKTLLSSQDNAAALFLEIATEFHQRQIRQAAVHVQEQNGTAGYSSSTFFFGLPGDNGNGQMPFLYIIGKFQNGIVRQGNHELHCRQQKIHELYPVRKALFCAKAVRPVQ